MSSSSRIAVIARSAAGQKFLELRVAKLQRLAAAPSRRQAALLHALASALNFLGDVRRALQASAQAVLLAPRKRKYKWLHLKLGRHAAAQAAAAASWPAACAVGCQLRPVQRLHCSQLTCSRFFQEFACAQRPVIITGLQVTREAWTLDVIEQAAAQVSVEVKSMRRGSCEWAGLEVERQTTVAEFIRSVRRCGDDASGCAERGYLFDWSLPQVLRARARCDAAPHSFPRPVCSAAPPSRRSSSFLDTSPATCCRSCRMAACTRSAGDTRCPSPTSHPAPPPPPPQDTWPSLFIAPAGVGCGAHVDAFASNFWMAVLQVCAALLLCQFLCRL